ISELLEGQRLQHLFERPDPARQSHEGVAALVHDGLAIAQPVGDHELAHLRLAYAEIEERARDHPRDVPAMLENGARQHAHEPHPSPAVHEPPVPPRHLLAQLLGRAEVLGGHRVAGAAEDGDGRDQGAGLAHSVPRDASAARTWAMAALRLSPAGLARVKAVPWNRARSSSSLISTIRAAPGY